MCKLKTNQSENGNPQSQKIEKLSREVPRQQRALSAPPLLYKDYQAIAPRILFTGQDMAEKDYMEAIKQFNLIGLIPNNVFMGMNELDHTLVYGDSANVGKQLSMIRKANMLMKKRHMDTSIISVDQSEGLNSLFLHNPQENYNCIEKFESNYHWIPRSDMSFPISCSVFRESNPKDESYAIFLVQWGPYIKKIVSTVLSKISPEEVSPIQNQTVNLSIFISENGTQQSVWKKTREQNTWKHDVIIMLRYNKRFDINSIPGLSLSFLGPKLSPSDIIKKIFVPADNESFGCSKDPALVNLFTYYERILVHEIGHVLHAILHPVEFTLLNPVPITKDALFRPKFSSETEAGMVLKKYGEMLTYEIGKEHLTYAVKNEREMIAELFTALYMGIELPEQLYNWYIDHGGPKFYDTPII